MSFWLDGEAWMRTMLHLNLEYLNLGLVIGLILGALLLIRPLTVRAITPQQRVILWMTAWIPAYIPSWYATTNWLRILPVTCRSLVVPRTGWRNEVPAFLPDVYDGPGAYNLALPGGALVRVALSDVLVLAVTTVWVVGMAVLCLYAWRKDKKLVAAARRGRLLSWDDPLLQNIPELDRETTIVRLCGDLPCSFVRRGRESRQVKCRYAIYLQAELPPERLRLVLLHEAKHIDLYHCFCKCSANVGLTLYWWNPIMWLGYRYFCRDLELACDRAALQDLEPGQRRTYARTLVELGSGRQLWESPLSFGECDSALRVRAAVNFRPAPPLWTWREPLSGVITLLLLLFFLGGPSEMHLSQDLLLAYQRGGKGADTLVQDVEEAVSGIGGDTSSGVSQIWLGQGPADPDVAWIGASDSYIATLAGDEWYILELRWDGRNTPDLNRAGVKLLRVPPNLAGCERIV